MKAQLSNIPATPVTIQINNKIYTEPGNQTVLQVARKNGHRIPFNCQAGICLSCEAIIDGKLQPSCYTIIKDKMHVVEKSNEMSNWRQNLGDE